MHVHKYSDLNIQNNTVSTFALDRLFSSLPELQLRFTQIAQAQLAMVCPIQ